MSKPNYPLNFYKRMNGAQQRVAKLAPDAVESLVVELGDLISSFAPYVGSEMSLDANDIGQITALTPEFVAIDRLNRLANPGTGEGVFADNLRIVFNMARNCLKDTAEEGDLLLVKIAQKCGEIANQLAGED